jgi:hypothetical protein
MLTKKGERRTKPQWPPVRPLHRLAIGAQHTLKYWETHPTAWLWWAGRRQDSACGKAEIGFKWIRARRRHRPLMLTKKGDKRTKPLRPPVRPLHCLETGAQHTLKCLETHSSAWLWLAGLGTQPRACGSHHNRIGTYCEPAGYPHFGFRVW